MYNMDVQEQYAVYMCVFGGVQRNNFRGEPVKRVEVEVRVRKPKNGKAISKDEVRVHILTEELIDDEYENSCNNERTENDGVAFLEEGRD